MHVGFVGTGTMGNPMARCLIEAGHQLTVYDLRRESTTNLCEMGASWADSPRSVAESSQVVFTSLPGPDQVTQVVLDADSGILGGLSRGRVISTRPQTRQRCPAAYPRHAGARESRCWTRRSAADRQE